MKTTKENIYPTLTGEWMTAQQIKDKLKLQESVKSVGKYLAIMMARDQTVECKKIHNVRHYRLKQKVTVTVPESKGLFNEFVELMKDAMEYRSLKAELRKWKESMSSKGSGVAH